MEIDLEPTDGLDPGRAGFSLLSYILVCVFGSSLFARREIEDYLKVYGCRMISMDRIPRSQGQNTRMPGRDDYRKLAPRTMQETYRRVRFQDPAGRVHESVAFLPCTPLIDTLLWSQAPSELLSRSTAPQ
jgi:hypothetical protein